MDKKFGLFIKPKEELKKKVKTFVDDLELNEDEEGDEEGDNNYDAKYNKSNTNSLNSMNSKNSYTPNLKTQINSHLIKQQEYNSLKLSQEMSHNLLQDPSVYEYDSL